MRIVVTGGSGKLGHVTLDELVAQGHEVLNLDLQPPRESRVPFTRIDFTDFGQIAEALTGVDTRPTPVDAVVHLAAIPSPGFTTNAATFRNNVVSSYNVFAAARLAGIKNVVFASSETLLGLPFDEPPPYAPVDEEYPVRPESTYSLGKALDEEMARQFCRWDPKLKMIGLRFSNVMEPPDYATFPGFDADPQIRRWNLWAYIDARDGAQAIRRALEHDTTGMDVFIIANADTVMSRSSADLMAEVFPDVPIRHPLGEHETLLSVDKARRVLGYEPEHSWRTERGSARPER
jgi:nucleoside-diphosphate-sugar epimerase